MGGRSWWSVSPGEGKGRAGSRGRDRSEGQSLGHGDGEVLLAKQLGAGKNRAASAERGWIMVSSIGEEMERVKE